MELDELELEELELDELELPLSKEVDEEYEEPELEEPEPELEELDGEGRDCVVELPDAGAEPPRDACAPATTDASNAAEKNIVFMQMNVGL